MIKTTKIDGLLILEGGQTFEDERGFFREPYRRNEFEEYLGKYWVHVQENHAYSKKNVLRGIHVAPWDKMIYVPFGKVLSVTVDLRKDSSTFKVLNMLEIGEGNLVKLFVPSGVANSYFVLSDEAVLEYQVNEYWAAGREKGIAWDDPDLNIDWPNKNPVLSEKDKDNPSLKEYLEGV